MAILKIKRHGDVMKFSWNIYIFTLLCMGVARTAERLIHDSGGLASQYLPVILCSIFSLGVYGAVNKKILLNIRFWQCFYMFSIMMSISLSLFAFYLAFSVGGSSLLWPAVIVFVILFIIPAQIKIKEYSFKSPQIW